MWKVNEVIDKETLDLRIESLIENNMLENKPSNGETYFNREKVSDMPRNKEQENAPFRNLATVDPKHTVGVGLC